jgi:integrase
MSTAEVHVGTRNATPVPVFAQPANVPTIKPVTISDLLRVLEQTQIKGLPMLRSTCGVLSSFLCRSPEDLSIQAVSDCKDMFRTYLAGRTYAENSIRTYVNNLRILLRRAEEFGWSPTDSLPAPWRKVMDHASQRIRKQLVTYLAKIRSNPTDVTDDDVNGWKQLRIAAGTSTGHANGTACWLWGALRKLGVGGCRSNPLHTKYGISVSEFPEPLRSEVLENLRWKQAPFSPGRPHDGHHRAVTAGNLEDVYRWIYGYAVNVRGVTGITRMSDLVNEPVLTGWVEWRINSRNSSGYSVRVAVALLRAALRHHPKHKNLDLSWFEELLTSIPQEMESEARRRKAEKFIEYDVLERIPSLIRAERQKLRKNDPKNAQLALEELLITWLITLPWRQRNIRECRISGPDPNVFKARIPLFSELTKPEWVLRELECNPSAEFWQFRFKPHETKTGIDVHSLLPRQLVEPLEVYLGQYRPLLLQNRNTETLFVNKRGAAMDVSVLGQLVSELTYRYTGQRTTPHRFRDIIAYTWLKHHPTDFLSLAKLLWHRNVNTTIKIYGARFNESSGVAAMESWLDSRALNQPMHAGHYK